MSQLIKSIAFVAIICILHTVYVSGHGAMVMPHSWFDKKTWVMTKEGYKFDYFGMKSGMMCSAGYDIKSEDLCPGKPKGCSGAACMWFTNYTFVEKPTFFNPKFRTYPHIEYPIYTIHNPWRAPGSAHIDSPCGVAGGNPDGCDGSDICVGGGYGYGPKAEDFHFRHQKVVTNWTRGSVVEAAWGIRANHGGGYSYRLCKVPKEGIRGLTEECFQEIPLEFVGKTQWVQYGEDTSTRVEFPAVRVSTGTFPKGSQWTKNPIPACNGLSGGFMFPTHECPNGKQFPPPKPDLFGFGVNVKLDMKAFSWSIIDKLHIPKSLEPGNYVLSFRWDCEQTPQVWNTCASINLE